MATVPSLERNLLLWNKTYDWTNGGEEWSNAWGGTDRMWDASIYPRIKHLLPAKTILEIAPGYGRCTQFLKNYCERLIVVDLSPRCIDACKQRFAEHTNIVYHVNDGKSLDMIEDQSIDFVFSYDSLVHALSDVMDAYVRQLSSKLTKTGSGFIHHSNLGRYRLIRSLTRHARKFGMGGCLSKTGLAIDSAWRGEDMTAEIFKNSCERHGLCCVSQELINWASRPYYIDAFSIFTTEKRDRDRRIVRRNARFIDEAARSKDPEPSISRIDSLARINAQKKELLEYGPSCGLCVVLERLSNTVSYLSVPGQCS